MKKPISLYFKVLAPLSVFLLTAPSLKAQMQDNRQSSLSIGLGFNYNSGGAPVFGGAPMFGWGNAGYSMGAIGGCFPAIGGGGFGGGGFMPPPHFGGGFGGGIGMAPPAFPPMPPPRPIVPPHVALGNQPWGGAWGFNRGPMIPGPMFGANCVPCGAGIMPMPMGPVAGGPMIGGGGYQFGRGGAGFGGGVFDDRMEWERSDYGDIAMATAFGLSMQTTNVYPVAFPRTQPIYGPTWFNTGDRESGFFDRDTHGAGRGSN
jgi:hypothetical protein